MSSYQTQRLPFQQRRIAEDTREKKLSREGKRAVGRARKKTEGVNQDPTRGKKRTKEDSRLQIPASVSGRVYFASLSPEKKVFVSFIEAPVGSVVSLLTGGREAPKPQQQLAGKEVVVRMRATAC